MKIDWLLKFNLFEIWVDNPDNEIDFYMVFSFVLIMKELKLKVKVKVDEIFGSNIRILKEQLFSWLKSLNVNWMYN